MIRLAILLALVSACDVSIGEDAHLHEMRKVQYWHDSRADVCFAEYALNRQYGQLYPVECTEKVRAAAWEVRGTK